MNSREDLQFFTLLTLSSCTKYAFQVKITALQILNNRFMTNLNP